MSESISTDSPSTAGLALVVGTPEKRRHVIPAVQARDLSPVEVDDPYTAMAELCRLPGDDAHGSSGVSVLLLSLQSLYREELQIITAVRQRFPRVLIWLTDLDGRSASLAEAMRLGIDGLLSEDGLHRLSDRSFAPADQRALKVSNTASPPIVPARQNGHARPMPGSPRKASQDEPRRVADPRSAGQQTRSVPVAGPLSDGPEDSYGYSPDEPLLSADELRALLQDPDPTPPMRNE